MSNPTIRKANIEDVKAIHKLIKFYADRRRMLARSLSELYEDIRDFLVFVNRGHVLGCTALHVTWEDLAEIKSLAVAKRHQRKGVGQKLVAAALKEATSLGVSKVFALTYEKGFFEKCGFRQVPKESLPHKIWSECVRCPEFPDCSEVPMMLEL
jgi:amino-acid N-acetyltransferase